MSVETAPSTVGAGGIGARASAAIAATFSCVTRSQIGEVHMVDRVAIDDAVLGPQILVLPIVILDRDREADRRDSRAARNGYGRRRGRTGRCARSGGRRGRAMSSSARLSTKRDRLRDGASFSPPRLRCWAASSSSRPAARPFREHPDMGVVANAVGAAAVADDVVVEVGLDPPALRAGIIGEDLAAVQPLLLARHAPHRRSSPGIGAARAPAPPRSPPPCPSRRHWRPARPRWRSGCR